MSCWLRSERFGVQTRSEYCDDKFLCIQRLSSDNNNTHHFTHSCNDKRKSDACKYWPKKNHILAIDRGGHLHDSALYYLWYEANITR